MKQDCLGCGHIWEAGEENGIWLCPNCEATVWHKGIQHPANKLAIIRSFESN